MENIQSLYTYIINVHHLYIYTKVPFVKKKIRREKADVLDNENAWLIKKALHSIKNTNSLIAFLTGFHLYLMTSEKYRK